ncbi:MAG: ABC transporter substrate-binding protein [Acidimicrobiia bacterium]|nr:ABC transporter substrate-binding protein [Acidimicrobiia bacterium]
MGRQRRTRLVMGLAVTLGLVFSACGAETDTADAPATTSAAPETTSAAPETTTAAPETTSAAEPAATTEAAMEEEVQTLRIAVSGDLPSIDPIFGQNTLTNMTLKNIYAQFLFYEPPAGDVGDFAKANISKRIGRAVERMEYSDGGRVVTMHIRQGVTFPTTGNPMTADDFLWFYERAFCAKASTMFNSNSYGVLSTDQVEKIDDYTIRVTLEQPSPIIENQLRAQVAVLLDSEAIKPHITEDDPCGNEWIAQNYAGNGVYRLVEWDRGQRIVFEANPAWAWDEPYFDRVELLVIPDASNRILLLETGEVDMAMDLDERQLARLDESGSANVLKIPGRRTLRLLLNNTVPPFDIREVRQALNFAVPHETIINDILQGTGVHLASPVSPNSTYYQDFNFGDLQKYSHDLDQAKALLAEAGLADGFEFTLMIPQGNTLVDEIATFLRSEYQKIGVTMNIERATGAVLAEAMGQGTGDAYLRGWFTDFVDEPFFHFNLWWRTKSVINWTQYTDPRMDELVALLKAETDKDAQRALAREAIEIIINDAPEVWIAGGATQVALAHGLRGYVHEPDELPIWGSLYRDE